VLVALCVAVTAAACSGSSAGQEAAPASSAPEATTTTEADLPPYEDPGDWLCHPELDETPCTQEVSVTAIDNEGARRRLPTPSRSEPDIDCFYVHPTIGEDPGENADLDPGPAEQLMTFEQAAPLSSVCRVFAPVFREATFHTFELEDVDQDALDLAYSDVASAFAVYLERWNDGRPFVLVGHSQGTIHLVRLLRSSIADDATVRSRLLGAYLLGISLAAGDDGTLADVPTLPLCHARGETGCAVTFSSFDVTMPPGDDSLFGRAWSFVDDHVVVDEQAKAACTNPASLGGGRSFLRPLIATQSATTPDNPLSDVGTTFVTYEGRLTAECVDDGRFVYLAVTNDPDPFSPEVEPIPIDDEPKWGLHSIEVGLTLGTLVDLIGAQAG
jgi:hypothetical protein